MAPANSRLVHLAAGLTLSAPAFLAAAPAQTTFYSTRPAFLANSAGTTTLGIQEPNNFALNIDNFTFGRSAPVPEASTTVSVGLLLVLGLGGMVIAARRKKATA